MDPSIDIRAYALGVLERFRKGFEEAGYLPPTGLVLEPSGGIGAFELDLSSDEAEKGSMARLQKLAQKTHALAVFTIMDTSYRAFPREGEELPSQTNDQNESVSFHPDGVPRPCICMEIKVEGQTPTIVLIPYRITEQGKFEFGEREEAPLDFMAPEPPYCDEADKLTD